MGNVTSLVNAVVREEFKKQELNAENRFEEEKVNKAVDEAAGCEQGVSIQDEADSEGAVEHTYPENVANTYLGLSALNDALAILAIVLANAIFGMLQEQKAENSLDALKQMTAPSARVLREGKMLEIPAAELVPGDMVFLEQGDVVPADVRLLNVNRLEAS